MANTLMTLLVSLGIDTTDFQKGIQGAEKSVGSLSSKMTSTGKSMAKVGAGMTLGLTVPIVAFGVSAVKSAQDAESAIADLNAVLESTGGIAGVTLDELTSEAAALQKITKFSNEAVMASQGMLLTFTNIGKDIFPAATMATLDMAEKFGMDASQAAITLGKALNDPISGVTALRRIGVMLTDEQEAQIKSFMAVGDIASAQAIIMKELSVEIGGVAEAAGATSSGQFAQFTNQLDNMKEIIGGALVPVLIRFMEALTPLIIKFSEASPAMQNAIIGFLAFVAVAGPVISIVGGLVTGIGAIIPVLTTVFTFITAIAIPGLATFATAVLLPLAPLLIIIAMVGLLYWAFKNNFGGIMTTVQQLWFLIKWAFDNAINKFKEVIAWIGNLMAKFAQMVLPDWLMPGSPTPFEVGLRGISSAMKEISSSSLPKLNMGLGVMGAGSSTSTPMVGDAKAGQNINIVINNPIGETVEEGIRKNLKNLNYLGVMG